MKNLLLLNQTNHKVEITSSDFYLYKIIHSDEKGNIVADNFDKMKMRLLVTWNGQTKIDRSLEDYFTVNDLHRHIIILDKHYVMINKLEIEIKNIPDGVNVLIQDYNDQEQSPFI
jgi:hypothetical protein